MRSEPAEFLTCIHVQAGLCATCQEAYDDDPEGYLEFGDHAAGIARWQAFAASLGPEALDGVGYTIVEEVPECAS